ncbi:MAG: MltA domain-containing protein [Pseudomonadota bacterium]
MKSNEINRFLFFAGIILIAFSVGCAVPVKKGEKLSMIKLPVASYPRFSDDMIYDGLEYGIQNSVSYLRRLSPDTPFFFGEDLYTAAHLIRSADEFWNFIRQKPAEQDLNRFIRSRFIIYKATGIEGTGELLFTGYYEPILFGSLEEKPPYLIPVYPRPNDLTIIDLSLFSTGCEKKTIIGRYTGESIVPYYDRREIDVEKTLEGKLKPLAYLKDPVDLFFLQIQGSGRLYLDSQEAANLHYHVTNGHPYRSIGKLLIETNKIPRSEMSMQRIRSYLMNHPEEAQEILNHNPSYVFFKFEKEGPKGSLDVVLTPGRSIALDRRIFPSGSLAFISSQKPIVDPDGRIRSWSSFSRFALNQDTGGAIRGPGRADLFWGNGPYAEIAAGHMQHRGQLFFLVLRPDP